MRIDQFLNRTNLLKRRAIAQDMCENKVVFLNDQAVKSSKEVKVGDILKLVYLTHTQCYEILEIPSTKTVPKSQTYRYIKKIGENHD